MIYRQPEWKVYVCQYVMSIQKEENPENIRNYLEVVLFYAESPDEAYVKAESCVEAKHDRYKDDDGNIISVMCHGICDIELLQDTWEQIKEGSHEDYGYDVCDVDLPESPSTNSLLTKREHLSIFK